MCVSDLPDAEVVGRGIVLDSAGRVVLGSAYGDRAYMRQHHGHHLLLAHRLLPSRSLGHVMPLQHFLARNYFHWVLESLGRLAMMGSRVDHKELRFLIDADAPGFVRQSLEGLFGITQDRLIAMPGRRVQAELVRYVSFPHVIRPGKHNINVYRPQVIHALAEHARRRLPVRSGEGYALLVLRANGTGRCILGYERIVERFPELPWRVVRLHEMPFMEQVRAFAGASIIVATHGAGLANLAFARGAQVVELFPDQRTPLDSSYFIQLSGALDLRHTIIGYPGGPHADLEVTDRLLEQLEVLRSGLGST